MTADIPIDKMLRDREAAELMGLTVRTFWRRVKDGSVPTPVRLGPASRWPQSEIFDVIERAKAAREIAHAA